MTLPTLSVVMPNYNHARFLRESLGAILTQSQRPLEVIVVDDCSTDDSVEIIEELAQNDPVVRLVRNSENLGVVANMNRGLGLASGDYVQFAAADDCVLPGFYEQSLALLSQYPQAAFCCAEALLMDEEGNVLPIRASGAPYLPRAAETASFIPPEKILTLLWQCGDWISGYTIIHRRQVLQAEGGFRPELGPLADGVMDWVEAVKHGLCFIPKPLVMARVMPTSYSGGMNHDSEELLAWFDRAAQLMSCEYADLFPPDYMRHFQRSYHFAAAIRERYKLQAAEQQYLARLERGLITTQTTDRVFLRIRRVSLYIGHHVEMLYYLLRYRQLNKAYLRWKFISLLGHLRTAVAGR